MDYDQKRYIKITRNLLPQPIVRGKGFVNEMINKMPFQAHLPGYSYAGPGTFLDLNLEKGVKPKNLLDEACMFHDIAYDNSKNLKDRHIADYKLEQDSWKRFKSDDSDLSEKSYAWLVSNAMKAKRWLGAGVERKKKKKTEPTLSAKKETMYRKYPVALTLEEQQIIGDAKKPLTLKLDHTQFVRTKASVQGETFLPLTTYQLKKVKTAIAKKKRVEIKLSLKQLNYIRSNNKQGGFLPAIAMAMPAIAAVGSLISSAVNTYNNKKANDRLIEEKVRHNKALEASKTGTGLKKKKPKSINKTLGNGLFDELMKKSKKKKSLL